MRTLPRLLLSACLLAAPLCAPFALMAEEEKQPADVPAIVGHIGGGWTEDYAAALRTAAAENKDILMEFTGSDWCCGCKILRKEVYNTELFAKEAPAMFVLLELDYPQRPQDAAVKAQNAKLKKAFDIESYPTLFLADSEGRPYACTGAGPGKGPEAHLKKLDKLRAVRVQRDAKFAEAQKAEGAAKARLLGEGLAVLKNDDMAVRHYRPIVDEILSLDADGAAGLKAKWEPLAKGSDAAAAVDAAMAKLRPQARTRPAEAVAELETLAATPFLPGKNRQQALFIASQLCQNPLKDNARALKFLDDAIAAEPHNFYGKSHLPMQRKFLLTAMEKAAKASKEQDAK